MLTLRFEPETGTIRTVPENWCVAAMLTFDNGGCMDAEIGHPLNEKIFRVMGASFDLLRAAHLSKIAFTELAKDAGDVPIWNMGGVGYEASRRVSLVLDSLKEPALEFGEIPQWQSLALLIQLALNNLLEVLPQPEGEPAYPKQFMAALGILLKAFKDVQSKEAFEMDKLQAAMGNFVGASSLIDVMRQAYDALPVTVPPDEFLAGQGNWGMNEHEYAAAKILAESLCRWSPKEQFDHDPRFDVGGEFYNEANPDAVRSRPYCDEIMAIYAKDIWGEHPDFSRTEWGVEAGERNTQLGYWDWVQHQIDACVEDEMQEDESPIPWFSRLVNDAKVAYGVRAMPKPNTIHIPADIEETLLEAARKDMLGREAHVAIAGAADAKVAFREYFTRIFGYTTKWDATTLRLSNE